jgi:hypothetical protein
MDGVGTTGSIDEFDSHSVLLIAFLHRNANDLRFVLVLLWIREPQ